MKRVRDLAIACARAYVESREKLGFPLLPGVRGEGDAVAAVSEEVADNAR
jgi:hypothetical protein